MLAIDYALAPEKQFPVQPNQVFAVLQPVAAHLSLGATLQWRATGAPPLAGLPHTFIAAVAYDPLRDDSLALAEFCKERGVFEGALSGNPGLHGSPITSGMTITRPSQPPPSRAIVVALCSQRR
jgi:hypothetical protein